MQISPARGRIYLCKWRLKAPFLSYRENLLAVISCFVLIFSRRFTQEAAEMYGKEALRLKFYFIIHREEGA